MAHYCHHHQSYNSTPPDFSFGQSRTDFYAATSETNLAPTTTGQTYDGPTYGSQTECGHQGQTYDGPTYGSQTECGHQEQTYGRPTYGTQTECGHQGQTYVGPTYGSQTEFGPQPGDLNTSKTQDRRPPLGLLIKPTKPPGGGGYVEHIVTLFNDMEDGAFNEVQNSKKQKENLDSSVAAMGESQNQTQELDS